MSRIMQNRSQYLAKAKAIADVLKTRDVEQNPAR
jgi:hypothetical protein